MRDAHDGTIDVPRLRRSILFEGHSMAPIVVLPKQVPCSLIVARYNDACEMAAEQERTRRQVLDLLKHVRMDFIASRPVW